MSRVKTIKVGDEHPELVDMFNQLVDPNKADPEIIYPKYVDIKNKTIQVIRLLTAFTTSPIRNLPRIDVDSIISAIKLMESSLEPCNYTENDIQENYTAFKNIYAVQESIVLCSYLSPFKQSIGDSKNLSDKFIKTMVAGTKLLPFSSIDFHTLWFSSFVDKPIKEYILNWFNMLYNTTLEIYNIVISPDIDISKFSDLLVEAIAQVQKHPELSRCNKAFSKLRNSVDLLKENFSNYHKDFVQSSNPTIIIESFIHDVSKKETADAETTYQFRKIIQYYRKASANNPQIKHNPQMDQLLNILDSRTSQLEKHVGPHDESDNTASQVETPNNVNLENNESFLPVIKTKRAPKRTYK